MTSYYGVVGNRDYIKLQGQRLPFWHFLDRHPAGWLCLLAYARDDVPTDRPRIWDCGAWSYKAEDVPRLGRNEMTPAWALVGAAVLSTRGTGRSFIAGLYLNNAVFSGSTTLHQLVDSRKYITADTPGTG